MAAITYKCPNCDGGLVFDPASQKYHCEYCLSDFTQEELERLSPEMNRRELEYQEPDCREPNRREPGSAEAITAIIRWYWQDGWKGSSGRIM